MTHAERLFDCLANAALAFNRKLTKAEWLALTDAFLAKEFPKGKRRVTPIAQLSEDDWIAELEADPAMEGVDIRREIGRCQFYWKGKLKVISRARIKNWLLKAEKTFVKPMNGASSRKLVEPDVYKEPEGWQAVAQRLYPGTDIAERAWPDLPTDVRAKVLKAML